MIENKNITSLALTKKIVDILHEKEIFLIKDLWVLSRKDLKKLGLSDQDIHQIVIKLQLNGIDLNKKVYAKM